MNLPEWDPAKKHESLMTSARFLREQARAMFLKDGTHVEILFIFSDTGIVQPVPIAPPMTREEVTRTLREQLPDSEVYGLVYIAEAWGYFHHGPDDPMLKKILRGETRPSELSEEDRSEVLLVSVLARDGRSETWYDEILRAEDDTVTLGRTEEQPAARFPLGNVFP